MRRSRANRSKTTEFSPFFLLYPALGSTWRALRWPSCLCELQPTPKARDSIYFGCGPTKLPPNGQEKHTSPSYSELKISRFLFVTYTIIQNITSSEMYDFIVFFFLKLLDVMTCAVEGDMGLDFQTSPIPLAQEKISFHPNPAKKTGENPVPFQSWKNDSHSRVFYFSQNLSVT